MSSVKNASKWIVPALHIVGEIDYRTMDIACNHYAKGLFRTITGIVTSTADRELPVDIVHGILSPELLSGSICTLIRTKGLSIQKLAKEVSIGSSSLCRWENCQADIKGSQLIVLARYFDVSVDYLLGLED